MLSTTTTIPPETAAALQACSLLAYENGITPAWHTFYDQLMKKIVHTSASGSASGGAKRKARTAATPQKRARGRPAKTPGAEEKSATRATRAKKSGPTINTKLFTTLVEQRPGITMPQVIAEFPGSNSNIIGRVVQGAATQTKKGRLALVEKRGDGYYITTTGQQLKAA